VEGPAAWTRRFYCVRTLSIRIKPVILQVPRPAFRNALSLAGPSDAGVVIRIRLHGDSAILDEADESLRVPESHTPCVIGELCLLDLMEDIPGPPARESQCVAAHSRQASASSTQSM
jgi:hypothetical protein